MRLFDKVAIIGVGLIGGSLGLAIKKKKLANEVVGISRHQQTIRQALKIRAIDKGSCDINLIKGADLIILAAPVKTIIKLAPKIARAISKSCIVTDVGSTKEEIVIALEKIFPNYVGTHPLAGSEKRSIFFARQDLFQGSLCIFTPTHRTSPAANSALMRLWKALGVRIEVLSPRKHDEALGMVSHLPHCLAFSLMNTVPVRCLKFSGRGLKDTTRIAASDTQLWTDIFLSNRKNLLEALRLFQSNLRQLESALKSKNLKKLAVLLKQAKQKRAKF